jgi:O-antigen/teichoic acid export membrane protein
MRKSNTALSSAYLRDVMASVIRLLFSLVLNVLILSMITRLLGEIGRGLYAKFLLFTEATTLFAGFGFQFYLSYYAATKGYDHNLKLLIAKVIALSSFISTVLVYYFLNKEFSEHKNELDPNFFIVAAYVLFSISSTTITMVMQGLKMFTIIAKIEIAKLVMVASILTSLYLLEISIHIVLIVYLIMCVNFVSLIFNIMCVKIYKNQFLGTIQIQNCGKLKPSLALKSWLSDIMGYFSYRLNWFFINSSLSVSSLAHYSAASQLAEKIWSLPASVSQVVTSYAATSASNAVDTTVAIVKVIFSISVILALILIVFSKYIVLLLFSEDFLPAVPILVILLLGTVPMSLTKVFAAYLAGIGKIKYNLYTLALLIFTNVTFLFFFGGYGVIAVSYSIVCGYVVATVTSLAFFCFECKLSPITFLPTMEDIKNASFIIGSRFRKKVL